MAPRVIGGCHDQSGQYPDVLLHGRVLRRTCNRGRNAACLTKAETPIHPAPIAEAEQRQREFEKQKAAEAEAAKERDRQAYRERGWPSG